MLYEFRIKGLHGGLGGGIHSALLYREVRGWENVALQTAQGRLVLQVGELDLQQVQVQDQQDLVRELQLAPSRSLLSQHAIATTSLLLRRSLVLEECRIDAGSHLCVYGECRGDTLTATLITDKSKQRLLFEALAALSGSWVLLPLAVAIILKVFTG